MQQSCCKKNGRFVESVEWIWLICRNSRTSGTHVLSLLHLLQEQPHCNTIMVSLLQILQGELHYRYPHYFLITVCTERATLQITRDNLTTLSDGRTTLQYKRGLLITVSAARATLQVPTLFPHYCLYRESHTASTLFFPYYRGGCEGSLIDTHLIE